MVQADGRKKSGIDSRYCVVEAPTSNLQESGHTQTDS